MSHMIQNSHMQERIAFTEQDNATWNKLYTKQCSNIQDKAFSVFLDKLTQFDLPADRVPQLYEVSEKIRPVTGWQVVPVPGLVGYKTYFNMLADRKFPSAINIRKEYEEDLSKDPDIFHEVFGHCTMLLSQDYADFMQEFARFALSIRDCDRPLIARLIWFTTETGLINIDNQVKIYGSSIMSSFAEAQHCMVNNHKPFNIVDIFREPFRADIMQKVYYIVDDINQVYELINNVSLLFNAMSTARKLGELPALFPVVHNKYSNIGHCVELNSEQLA
jgi:phenylalanine-4-hydroxylase